MYAEAAIKAGKHVFVEKPHAIDPVGVRRMAAVCDLAKTKGLSILSGLQSRFDNGWQETVKRIHDGAIGDVVAMQSMFLRGPYRLEPRQANVTEIEFQYRNWYHFLWLSGDDVPQSLVHNIDRMCWIMHEQLPEWAFGLGGRSGLVRRSVWRHVRPPHGRLRVQERHASVCPVPNPRRLLWQLPVTSSWARKGQCDLDALQDHRRNQLAIRQAEAEEPLSGRAGGVGRGHPERQADQQRLPHAQRHHDWRDGADRVLYGRRSALRRSEQIGPAIRAAPDEAISTRSRRLCRMRPGTTRCRCRA